jgi:hypothetical protein
MAFALSALGSGKSYAYDINDAPCPPYYDALPYYDAPSCFYNSFYGSDDRRGFDHWHHDDHRDNHPGMGHGGFGPSSISPETMGHGGAGHGR